MFLEFTSWTENVRFSYRVNGGPPRFGTVRNAVLLHVTRSRPLMPVLHCGCESSALRGWTTRILGSQRSKRSATTVAKSHKRHGIRRLLYPKVRIPQHQSLRAIEP
jgi:hypothetical protein